MDNATLTCINCGKTLPAGAKFCRYCGAAVPLTLEVPPKPPEPVTPPPVFIPPEPPKKSKGPIIALVAAAVVLIAVAAFLLLRQPGNKAEPYVTAAPTPTPALTAEPYFGDLSGYQRLYFSSAYANSQIDYGVWDYPAEKAIDGNVNTCWQEDAKGDGEGVYLELSFGYEQDLSLLTFRMGFAKTRDLFHNNGRPSRLLIEFSDGSSFSYDFPDTYEDYTIALSRTVRTSWVRLTIEAAYTGDVWDDTAISEVTAYGPGSGTASAASYTFSEPAHIDPGSIIVSPLGYWDSSAYYILSGSFLSRDYAELRCDLITSLGYPEPWLYAGGDGVYYVLIGEFESKDDADLLLPDVRENIVSDAIVIKGTTKLD